MAPTIGLTEAVAALREHFGDQLQAGQDEGRERIADALRDRFGIDGREAGELVRTLEEAHVLRWVWSRPPQEVVMGAPDTGQGMGFRAEEGHWEW